MISAPLLPPPATSRVVMQPPGAVVAFGGDFKKLWCIYEHRVDDQLIYIGCCKLNEVYGFPDAQKNTRWNELVNDTTVLHISIVATGARFDCWNKRGKMALERSPVCNMHGQDMRGRRCAVRCVETNQIFDTQREAAKALGINQGQLSNHLMGKPGYRSVGGKTFQFAEIPQFSKGI